MNALKSQSQTVMQDDIGFKVLLDHDVVGDVGITQCPLLNSANKVLAAFKELVDKQQELLVTVALDSELRLLRWSVVAHQDGICVGDFKIANALHSAIMSHAAGIILIHCRKARLRGPTHDDGRITKHVARAASLLGYQLIDHLIVDHAGYWSLENPIVAITTKSPCRIGRRQRTLAS